MRVAQRNCRSSEELSLKFYRWIPLGEQVALWSETAFYKTRHGAVRMIKAKRNAVELAKLVRNQLAQPKLRVAVFPKGKGWEAKVYANESSDRQLRERIDQVTQELNEKYELES